MQGTQTVTQEIQVNEQEQKQLEESFQQLRDAIQQSTRPIVRPADATPDVWHRIVEALKLFFLATIPVGASVGAGTAAGAAVSSNHVAALLEWVTELLPKLVERLINFKDHPVLQKLGKSLLTKIHLFIDKCSDKLGNFVPTTSHITSALQFLQIVGALVCCFTAWQNFFRIRQTRQEIDAIHGDVVSWEDRFLQALDDLQEDCERKLAAVIAFFDTVETWSNRRLVQFLRDHNFSRAIIHVVEVNGFTGLNVQSTVDVRRKCAESRVRLEQKELEDLALLTNQEDFGNPDVQRQFRAQVLDLTNSINTYKGKIQTAQNKLYELETRALEKQRTATRQRTTAVATTLGGTVGSTTSVLAAVAAIPTGGAALVVPIVAGVLNVGATVGGAISWSLSDQALCKVQETRRKIADDMDAIDAHVDKHAQMVETLRGFQQSLRYERDHAMHELQQRRTVLETRKNEAEEYEEFLRWKALQQQEGRMKMLQRGAERIE